MSICCAVPYLKNEVNKNVLKHTQTNRLQKQLCFLSSVSNNISTYNTQNVINIPLVILNIWQFKDNSGEFGFDCKINVVLRSALHGKLMRRKSSM